MDRRELLKQGAALACVAALPKLLDLPLVAQNSPLPRLAWPETTASLAHRNAMIPLLKKFNASKKITSLTPNEWDTLAIHHQYYHGLHGDMGHLMAIDAAIKQHQAYLKTKYDPASVDMILRYGTENMSLRYSGKIHEIALKARVKQYGQLDTGGRYVEAQYYNYCDKFFEAMAVMFAIFGLLLAPEVGIVFVYVGLANDGFALFGCP